MIQNAASIRLSDGRTLGYAEYGNPDGSPVMYFHGGNGSRIEAKWFHDVAREKNIRLLAPERPGFGLSDFQPERTLLHWPDDTDQLADALQLEQFAIFGLSGGGPHVAAVAHQIPDRLTRAAIVSGAVPPGIPGSFKRMWLPIRAMYYMASLLPGIQRVLLAQQGKFYADPERMTKQMLRALPAPDKDLIARRPEIIDIFAASALEAHRNGIAGDALEWQLYVKSWGFDIKDIHMEIGLWFGEVDGMVPLAMGDYFARTLPYNHYHIVPDGGHFSTINNHIEAILSYLTEDPVS